MTSILQVGDIVHAFRESGIQRGDTLMLHSDSMVLAQLPPMSVEERCRVFFEAMDDLLGPDGTLILPTFTYSFTQSQNFNVQETPSTVGMLTNYFRTMPAVKRSRDPNFSIAVKGRLADEMMSADINECFGPRSVFALLEKHDAWLAAMGCGIDRFTFIHYIEQQAKVNYRYFKTFSGIIESDNKREFAEVHYFVRDLNRKTLLDLSLLQKQLAKTGKLHMAPMGRVALNAIRCSELLHEGMTLLSHDQSALIEERNFR